ncbi:catalase [Tieghemostelium lacteum]|uniref:Catalase n=1 Tax=Tieghemostelium lacteum TaxID=361077 RepID=A0A151Z515_TIELA|nr:catalase [Tieghemostelium lacteum]|eukprot:KYQ89050.1 catalase [Tieghemostelium lacteum]
MKQLDCFRLYDKRTTTNTGTPVADDVNSLKGGDRGPSLLEDFIMREKITHFDHERIPERIVHARGSGAHGYFECYQNFSDLTKANFLSEQGKTTPVFVRFSTVQGPRGSADTVRDVRGFAVKFYTDEGNYDFVGNNMPVFFIQDAMQFPDFVHAVKMEPDREIPTGASAHDTFWDFVSLKTEASHMVMWLMSDRAIPISLRHMQGFGVHTFRLINAQGQQKFCKFIWKPLSGACSLVWDECQKLAGKDADYNRGRLWEDIENGDYPQWELGIQLIDSTDTPFDILDATKLIPEEKCQFIPLGRMTLNRNPDNFFSETEQVAFCPSHLVPGIDFTDDPLLQGRLFSYLDTQISRLGGPNFNEIPINRPICPFMNNQRDGIHRQTINPNKASYFPNSINPDGVPVESPHGFTTFPEHMKWSKTRHRSESFNDHFSQSAMFWNSMSPIEKEHIVKAFTFELSKVKRRHIQERVVNQLLVNVDLDLAHRVSKNLGIEITNRNPVHKIELAKSPALSQLNLLSGDIKSRKVAILLSDGVSKQEVDYFSQELCKLGACCKLIAPTLSPVKTSSNETITPDTTMIGSPSILFDAVVVPRQGDNIQSNGVFKHYILEAYNHLKPILLSDCFRVFLEKLELSPDHGLIIYKNATHDFKSFTTAMASHRIYSRESKTLYIPA